MPNDQQWQRLDPFASREASRYDHPVPSREYLLAMLQRRQVPLTFEEIAELLAIRDDPRRVALNNRLHAMVRDGQVVINRRKGFMPVNSSDLVRGRVQGHPDGFGFLTPDTGGRDIYLAPAQMRGLLHGDRAVVRIAGEDRQGRPEGRVAEVLERANQRLVGRLFYEQGLAFVAPDNRRIHQDVLVPSENTNGAENGQFVIVELVEQPTRRHQPIGRIEQVLGDHMAPGMEIEVAIHSNGIPYEWPQEVLDAAARFGDVVAESDIAERRDLRDLAFVTIDGEDAKDFDDAVWCERKQRGWRLLVAIADVSHYVRDGNELDDQARLRGTSVYFPGQVVPMLPEALSNGLCSLNPAVDRLAMVADLRVDEDGELFRSSFYPATIRSQARLTYTEVAEILVQKKAKARRRRAAIIERLEPLYDLFKVLLEARHRRGAIDFETVETRILFNAERKIESIQPTERNDAHRLIEECMILANVAAARFLARYKMPALYRVHDGPSEDRLKDLRQFLGEQGLKLEGGEAPEPKHYAHLLEQIGRRADAQMLQTVMLRSLSQAVYSPECRPHFGLALAKYAHFTSPIRRYPDLLVHRAIRHALIGGKPNDYQHSHEDMLRTGEQCSMTERRADQASRDATDWLKCEYMLDRVGDEFAGMVTGVTGFGLFVTLTEVFVEGLLHITSLPRDYYRFDAMRHHLRGERGGQVFRLGDPLRIRVARVDLDERKIDFDLVDGAPKDKKRRRRR